MLFCTLIKKNGLATIFISFQFILYSCVDIFENKVETQPVHAHVSLILINLCQNTLEFD